MSHRIERVSSLMRQEISGLLQRQVKDPRINQFVAVTEVSISADMKYAKVFVSCMGSEEEKKTMLKGLGAASNFLRNQLSKRLRLRRIPELRFEWDDSIERGDHLLQLLDKVSAEHPPEESSD
ncbi:Ribosome-binding factor A [subsurface metagenome]